jgi:hypothetical protein
MTTQELVAGYMALVNTVGPAATGTYARKLTDEEAHRVYDHLAATNERVIVRPLYYDYDAQRFRW